MSAFDDNFAYALVSSSERTLRITGVNPSKYHAGNLNWRAIPEIPALYTGPTLAYNGYGAFENAFSVVEIASGAFNGRTEFAEGPLVLPKSLVIIGANAFNGVKITGRLTIPASVTSIGANAFNGTLIDELVVENETTSDLLSGVVDATRVTSKEIAARIATDGTLNTLKVTKANPTFTGTTTIPTAVISTATTVANATIHTAANIATNVTSSATVDYYEPNVSEKNKNARFRVLTTAGNLLSAGGVGENVAPIEIVLTDGTYRTGAALVSELLAKLNTKNITWIGGSAIVWTGTTFDANAGAIKLGYITPAPGSVTDPAIVIRTKFVSSGVSYNSSGVLGAVGASVGGGYEDGAFVLTYGNRVGINFPQAVNLGTPMLTVTGSAALDGSVAVSGEWGFNANKPRYNAQALATQSYAQSKIQLVNGTSLLSTVKTLADIGSAIGADPQFAVTVQNSQSAIIQSITSMASVRSTAVSSLSSSLSAQVSALQSVDLSLSSALSDTIPVRVSQVGSVSTLLQSTVSGLQSTDVVTSTAMSEATSARSSQTQSLNSAISTAASLLQAADTVLSTSISAAVLTRSANVSANSVTWSTHVSSLDTTDASLSTAVVSASGARSSAIASLSSSIMVDAVPVLESADAAFTTALQSQTVQRVASVAALSGAISTQVSAAESINVAILPQITASASTDPHATTGTVFNLLSVNVNDSVTFVKSGGGVLAVGDKVVISYSPTDYLKGTVTAVLGSNVTMTVTFKTTTATETTIHATTGSFGASVASLTGSHMVPISNPAFVAGSNFVVTSMTGALFSSTNTGTYSVSLLDASNATIATAASEFFNASQTPKTHSFISAFLAKGATNLKQKFSHSAGLSTQIIVNFADYGAYTVMKGYAVPYSSGAVTLEESNGGLQSARISAVAALSAGALSTANSLSAVIQTNQSALTANVSERSAAVASFASAASQSVSSLQSVTSQLGSALSVASSERSAGISSLSSAVTNSVSAMASTATHISGALSAQVSNRSVAVLAAVTSLVGAAPSTLDTLFEIATALDAGPALYSMISATSTSLASNVVARSTGVSSISASLSAVASTLHVADASLVSGMSAATADRIGRIASVSSGTSAFVSFNQSRLDSVSVGISSTVQARVSGVTSVSASLASVASALQTADSAVLSAGISAAVSARASGVASSSVALSSAVASLQTSNSALLSTAISVRQSGTESVSVALSGVVSSQHSSIAALSTAYSALNAGINLSALADVAAVNSAIEQVVGGGTVSGLDTLAEIAAALNNNASLATTLNTAINGKAGLSAVASLSDAVLLKASQTDLSQLVSTVGTRATTAEVSQLQTAVSSMASTVNGSISSQVQSLQSNMTVSTNVFQLLSNTIRQVDTLYIHNGFVNADGSINYRVNKLANMVLQSSSLTFAVDANYAVTKVTQVIAVRFDPTQVSVKYSSRGVEYTLNPISLVNGVHTFSIDSSSTADYANNATAVVITANETAIRAVPDNSPFTVAKLALSAYTYATPTVQTPYDATTWSDATGKISQVLRINFESGVHYLQIDGAVHVVWGATQFVHTLEYFPGANPAGAVVVKALSSPAKLESAPLTLTNVYNDYPQHAVPSEVGGSKSVSRSGSTHTYAVSYSSATASAVEWQMYDVGTGTYSALSDSGIPFGTFMYYGFERIGQPLFRLRAKTSNGRRASAFVVVNAEAVVFSKPTLSSVAYNTLSAGSYRLNATYAVESQVSAVKVVNPYTGGTYIPSQAASGGSVTIIIDYTAAQVASNLISVAVIALANANGLESAASDAFIPIGQYAAPTVSNTSYSATRSAGSYTACSATLTCGVANGVTAVRVLKPNLSEFHSNATSLPNAFYLKTGGSNWRDFIPLLVANTTDNNLYWQPDQGFYDVNYNSANQVANQFSYFAAYWLNANRASNGQSFSINTYATGTFFGSPNSQPFSGIFTFTATSDYPVTTYNGSLSTLAGITYILTPQTDGINAGIVASGGVKVSNVAVANGSASPVVTFVNTVAPLDLVVVAQGNETGHESAASAQQTLLAQYAAPTISNSVTYSGNTASMTYTVSAGVTAVQVRKASDGTVIASGVTTSVNTGNQTASVSIALTENVSIVVVALGNASGRESAASATQALVLPLSTDVVQDANGTTIKYVGSAAAVPTSSALFFQANPRGTGPEWFAVVKQGMKAAISSYASGTNSQFRPPGQSQPVPFNNIVTTLMTDMSSLFTGKSGFNDLIASWDTGAVTSMAQMFHGATAFNRPIGAWNTGAVTNMGGMFVNGAFNQPIGTWNTAAVTDMSNMFYGVSAFNQPIGTWNTGAVTNMNNMFNGATAFNQAIGSWNTGAVTNMSFMFYGATAFNQPIDTWNTGAVTNMNYMFYNASAFNQNISGWNVGALVTKPPTNFSTGSALTAQNASVWFPIVQDANGTTIKYVGSAAAVPTSSALFIQANPRGTGTEWFAVVKQDMKAAISDYANGTNSQFRPPGQSQPVPFNNIVTTLMTDMLILFRSASSFNDPIASWDTSAVTNMAQMFYGASAFNQPIGAWNTAAVTNMSNMFVNTTNFNQAIGSWNTGAVTDMSYMFYGATAFNQPIDTWNTVAVTNMSVMFYGATAFNRPIGAWNTAAVTNMSHMFYSATAFNQPIGTWNTGAVTNMNFMFYGAAAFNQNISGWNVGAVVTKPPTNFSDGSALTAQNNPFGSAFAAPTLSGSITYSGNTANMTYAVAAGVTAVQVRKASDGSVITSGVISNQTASISVALTETISIVVVALGNASGRESAASATQELLVQYAAPTLSGGVTYSGNTASMTYTVAAGVTAVQVRKASDGSVIASGVISNQTASISVALTETISIVVVALGNANGRESAASATQELLAQYAKPQSVSSLRTVTATTGFVDLYNSPYVSNRIYPGANLWDQPTGSKLSVTFNLNNTAAARRVIIGRYYNVASFNEYPFIYWGLETGNQNNVRFIMNDDRENAVSVINNVSTGINYTLTITTDKANNRLLFTAINADTSQQIGTQVTKTLTSGELAQFVTTDLFVTYINYYYENVFFTSIQLLGSVSNVTIAKYISSMFELSEYYLASAPKLRVFNNDGTQIGSDVTTTTAVNSVSYFKAVVTYESTMINQPVMKVKYMSSGSDNKRDSEFSDAVIGINIPVYAAPTISGSITYSGNTASMTYTVAAGVTAVQVRKASDGSVITSGVTTSVNTGNQTASVSIALTENVSIVVVALGNASGQESAASATQNLVLQTVETPVLSGSITYSGNTANMTYTVVPQVTAVQVRKASDGTVISSGVTTSVNTSNQTASVSIALTETISIVVVASNSSGLTSAASAQQTLIAQYAAPTLSGSITYSGNTASMTYAVAAGVTAVQVRKASDGSVIASGVTTSVSGTSASISVALTETISIVVVALGNANGRESAASAREALRVIYPAPVLSGSVTYSGSRANLTYTVSPSVYNALNFDGVNDGVNFGVPDWTYSSQILNTMTIECWFRTTDTNNQKSAAWFISRNSTLGSSGSHFALGMTSTGHITAWLQTNSIGNTFNVTGYGTYNDMQWHHVAVTYEQSTYYMLNGGIKLYIDGNLNIHRNDLNDRFYPLLFNNTTRLILGNDDAGLFGGQNDRQFRGSLAEVRVWNVVRTENEILNNYSRGLIGNESGLVMYNRLDQGITNGNNVGITTLVNNMISGGSTGTLQNFDLTGTVSNWVSGPSKIHDLQMRNATDNSVITNNVTIIGISSTSVSVSLSANPISVVAVSLGNVNGRESVASAPQALTIAPTMNVTGITNLFLSRLSEPFNLNNSVTSNSSGAFSYSVPNNTVISINGSTATVNGTGSVVVTVTQAANGMYSSNTTTATLTVSAMTFTPLTTPNFPNLNTYSGATTFSSPTITSNNVTKSIDIHRKYGTPVLEQTITNTDDMNSGSTHYGWSLEISTDGQWIVVGNPYYDGHSTTASLNYGISYVYKLHAPSNTWNQVFVYGGGVGNTMHGYAVAISGNGKVYAATEPGAYSTFIRVFLDSSSGGNFAPLYVFNRYSPSSYDPLFAPYQSNTCMCLSGDGSQIAFGATFGGVFTYYTGFSGNNGGNQMLSDSFTSQSQLSYIHGLSGIQDNGGRSYDYVNVRKESAITVYPDASTPNFGLNVKLSSDALTLATTDDSSLYVYYRQANNTTTRSNWIRFAKISINPAVSPFQDKRMHMSSNGRRIAIVHALSTFNNLVVYNIAKSLADYVNFSSVDTVGHAIFSNSSAGSSDPTTFGQTGVALSADGVVVAVDQVVGNNERVIKQWNVDSGTRIGTDNDYKISYTNQYGAWSLSGNGHRIVVSNANDKKMHVHRTPLTRYIDYTRSNSSYNYIIGGQTLIYTDGLLGTFTATTVGHDGSPADQSTSATITTTLTGS